MAAAKIARQPPTRDELQGVFEELEGASDRAAGVLAAAHLEVEIERLLVEHFVSMDEGDAHMLFGPQGGVLSAAMAKVRLAHALGLFGEQTKEACSAIFDIRNMLAHAPRNVSFSTNAIKNKFDKLEVIEVFRQHGLWQFEDKQPSDAKEKYVYSVYSIILQISAVILAKKRRETEVLLDDIKKLIGGIRDLPHMKERLKLADALERLTVSQDPKPPFP